MDTLFLIYIGIAIVGILLSLLTVVSKNSLLLNVSIILSGIFNSFIGAMNFSMLPSAYTKQRLLALFCAILLLLPVGLNIFKYDFETEKSKKLVKAAIKISNILVIFINLILLYFKVL